VVSPSSFPPTIGVDVGGTKIAAAVVDAEGTIIAREQLPTEAESSSAIVAAITKVCQQLRAAAPAAVAVGVGAAGLVDVSRGVILGAPNISWRDLHLKAMLTERIGLPVIVDNDANVAALGEALHGGGRGAGDQLMVTVGTGIGGGIIIGGHIYRGHYGLGAEIGHIVLDPDGPPCGCGNRGCWEQYASGTAIGRLARERVAQAPESSLLSKAGGDVALLTGEMVGEAAVAGDAFAVEIVSAAGRMLGVGMASLVNVLDPEVMVVGGGAAAGLGELLLGPARETMQSFIIGREWRTPVRVVGAALGNDAGVVGAAALARELV
jgi:glucokinase